MFALRGIAVSFSIFFLIYISLSFFVCLAWRKVRAYGDRDSAKRAANFLLAARLTPFALSAVVTLALAVPSFLLLEPRAADEGLSAALVVLGICGVLVLLVGLWRSVSALFQASRKIARWRQEADRETIAHDSVCVRRISGDAPPLTAAGIFEPSVWLSRSAEFVLSERELHTALRHEFAHVRRHDNLRKLVLRFVGFPGMAELEAAWREATEMAADDAAVTNASEALDLAAAVIKLSRLASREMPAALTTALVHSPAESLHARVERLLAWTERRQNSPAQRSLLLPLCTAATVFFTLAITYGELLARVHTATEWLVR
jgi:beta-lactamase regulating signal transducer with metallopeptidase domain